MKRKKEHVRYQDGDFSRIDFEFELLRCSGEMMIYMMLERKWILSRYRWCDLLQHFHSFESRKVKTVASAFNFRVPSSQRTSERAVLFESRTNDGADSAFVRIDIAIYGHMHFTFSRLSVCICR